MHLQDTCFLRDCGNKGAVYMNQMQVQMPNATVAYVIEGNWTISVVPRFAVQTVRHQPTGGTQYIDIVALCIKKTKPELD